MRTVLFFPADSLLPGVRLFCFELEGNLRFTYPCFVVGFLPKTAYHKWEFVALPFSLLFVPPRQRRMEAAMYVLITYDIRTLDAVGRKRLRRVAKICTNYGQRVQNSVFECLVDPAQCKKIEIELEKIIDKENDSLRFYYLGEKYDSKVKHIGAKYSYDMEGVLLI